MDKDIIQNRGVSRDHAVEARLSQTTTRMKKILSLMNDKLPLLLMK